ncbi:hypothetical protein KY331_03555 [Candidatus Woesearchaeota archaeon]|nr:hypothetical protein [Candidatus Woesearchaeota archaeon]
MNKFIKKLLLGLIVWAVPFIASVLIWDVEANAPLVSMDWFAALMSFTGAVGFAIAACIYFRKVKKDTVKEGWSTGIIWYIELLVLDYLVLVLAFGMAFADYASMFLTYLNVVALSILIGYVKK